MFSHRWKLRLEIETDQGVDGKDNLTLEVTGSNGMDVGKRAVNECIANDMASMCRMVIESGLVVCPTTMEESCEAFCGR